MAQISRSVVGLRIAGEDLIPAEVTSMLGCESTSEQTKGDLVVKRKKRTAEIGMWRMKATDFEPENLDAQILEILEKLSSNLEVWEVLTKKFKIDLFCGLFMKKSNEGITISPLSLMMLGERGILLGLDIYDPD
ncbi:MAG: hypothetical protein COB38_07260 [Gammaproteobacteria bacterium]|nr:MAG: hypothetical protein COB38_07260 [Gammaproteobacteria bacterium]